MTDRKRNARGRAVGTRVNQRSTGRGALAFARSFSTLSLGFMGYLASSHYKRGSSRHYSPGRALVVASVFPRLSRLAPGSFDFSPSLPHPAVPGSATQIKLSYLTDLTPPRPVPNRPSSVSPRPRRRPSAARRFKTVCGNGLFPGLLAGEKKVFNVRPPRRRRRSMAISRFKNKSFP